MPPDGSVLRPRRRRGPAITIEEEAPTLRDAPPTEQSYDTGSAPGPARLHASGRQRRRKAVAPPPRRLIGATYLHASTGRPVVVVDHECRRPRADGCRSRTGRLIVRCADTTIEMLFVTNATELLEQLALPCVALGAARRDGP